MLSKMIGRCDQLLSVSRPCPAWCSTRRAPRSSTVCQMIVACPDLVLLPSVLPVVFAQLPLKEDHEEYPIVYRCLTDLYGRGEPLVRAKMAKILALTG